MGDSGSPQSPSPGQPAGSTSGGLPLTFPLLPDSSVSSRNPDVPALRSPWAALTASGSPQCLGDSAHAGCPLLSKWHTQIGQQLPDVPQRAISMCHNSARTITDSGTVTAMDYVYARVTTTQQDLDRQLDALAKAVIDNKRIHSDKKSGATADRPGLIDVMDGLRPGDVLVVYTLDRLGLTVRDVLNHIHELRAAGIGLRTLADAIPIDTSKPGDAMSELAIVLLSLFAQRCWPLSSGSAAAATAGRRHRLDRSSGSLRRHRATVLSPTPMRAAALPIVKRRVCSIASVMEVNPAARAFASVSSRRPCWAASTVRRSAARRALRADSARTESASAATRRSDSNRRNDSAIP